MPVFNVKTIANGVTRASRVTADTAEEAIRLGKAKHYVGGKNLTEASATPTVVSPNINKILRQVGANRRFPRGAPMGKSNVHDSDRPVYFQEVRLQSHCGMVERGVLGILEPGRLWGIAQWGLYE